MKSSDKNDNNKQSAKIRRGDKQAFERLFKKHYLELSRFAWRYVKSKAIAEELVQEVFANIWEKHQEWNPSGSVRSYLYQAVKNQSIDYLRHQEIQKKYDPKWVQEREESSLNVEIDLGQKQNEIQETIKKEIDALPPRGKTTFKLSRYDGLTYREIAQVMDVSVKTVQSQMGRVLKRLRNRLSHLMPILLVITSIIITG